MPGGIHHLRFSKTMHKRHPLVVQWNLLCWRWLHHKAPLSVHREYIAARCSSWKEHVPMRDPAYSATACTLIVDGGQKRPSDKDLEKLYAHSTELYHITRATITLTLSTPPPFNAACTNRSLICDGSPSFFIIRSISGSRTISHKPSEQSNNQSRACKSMVKQSTSTLRLSPRPRSTRLRSGCV